MKIALLGAPGSGKTKVAHWLEGELGDLHIIDDYTENVERRFDLAVGRHGSWVTNLAIASERFGFEKWAEGKSDLKHRITCGTIIETTVYEAINAFQQDKMEAYLRCQALMHIFALYMLDTWNYDHAFYLPLGPSDNSFAQSVDQEIPYTIEKTNAPVTELKQGFESQTKQILETVHENVPSS